MDANLPKISIVIPTYNRKNLLKKLLESLTKSHYPKKKVEVIVVDDGSDEAIDDIINSFQSRFYRLVYLRNNEPMLKSYCVNRAAMKAKGDYLFIVDDDNEVSPECIYNLVKALENPNACIVAPVTLFKGTDIIKYCGGFYHPITGKAVYPFQGEKYNIIKDKPLLSAEVTPNAFMVRKDSFWNVGGFDGKEFPIGDEDGEFQLRVKKAEKKELYIVPRAIVYEVSESLMTGERLYPLRIYYLLRGKIKLIIRHKKKWQILTFVVFLPAYYLFYQYLILRRSNRKLDNTKALIRGIFDGLRFKEGVVYR
jgi:hypothetical protein